MTEMKKEAAASEGAAVVIPELVVTLRKPFRFEGEEYGEIDLSGIAALTAADALEIDDYIMQRRDASGYVLPLAHPFWMYYLAFMGSGVPIEAFQTMPLRAMRSVSRAVNEWLNLDEEPVSELVVPLRDPFTLNGKPVAKLDLSGLDDLTGIDDAAAEKAARRCPNAARYVSAGKVRGHQAFLFELAARALGVSASELDRLSLRDALQVRSAVLGFLAG